MSKMNGEIRNDAGDDDVDDISPYTIYSKPLGIFHEIYLSSVITNPNKYIRLNQLFREMHEFDYAKLYITTPGGRVDTGIQLINNILDCRGTVHTVIDSEANSMGATLFLAGHKMTVKRNASLMFHDFSWGTGFSKGHEHISYTQANLTKSRNVLDDLCGGFFSDDEIQDILNGRDIYLHEFEIMERLSRICSYDEETNTFERLSPSELKKINDQKNQIEKPKTTKKRTPKVAKHGNE